VWWELSPDAGHGLMVRHEEVHLWHSLSEIWNMWDELLWLSPLVVKIVEAIVE